MNKSVVCNNIVLGVVSIAFAYLCICVCDTDLESAGCAFVSVIIGFSMRTS